MLVVQWHVEDTVQGKAIQGGGWEDIKLVLGEEVLNTQLEFVADLLLSGGAERGEGEGLKFLVPGKPHGMCHVQKLGA